MGLDDSARKIRRSSEQQANATDRRQQEEAERETDNAGAEAFPEVTDEKNSKGNPRHG